MIVGVVLFVHYCVPSPWYKRNNIVMHAFSTEEDNICQYSDDPLFCQCCHCAHHISRGFLVNKQLNYESYRYTKILYKMYKKENGLIFEDKNNSFKEWLNANRSDLMQRLGISEDYWIYCRHCYFEHVAGYSWDRN